MTLFVCRCKPLCNFSGPQTVHKSLLGSKSEELVESFKFIQFVVGTGIDKVLYKMLMYSHTISSRVRKDTWLKGRKKKTDTGFLALGYSITNICEAEHLIHMLVFSPLLSLVSDWIMENVLRFPIFVYIPGNYCLLCLEIMCQVCTLAVMFP